MVNEYCVVCAKKWEVGIDGWFGMTLKVDDKELTIKWCQEHKKEVK